MRNLKYLLTHIVFLVMVGITLAAAGYTAMHLPSRISQADEQRLDALLLTTDLEILSEPAQLDVLQRALAQPAPRTLRMAMSGTEPELQRRAQQNLRTIVLLWLHTHYDRWAGMPGRRKDHYLDDRLAELHEVMEMYRRAMARGDNPTSLSLPQGEGVTMFTQLPPGAEMGVLNWLNDPRFDDSLFFLNALRQRSDAVEDVAQP